PSSPTLLSATAGLPPQVYALLGGRVVARETGVPIAELEAMRAYADPAIPHALRFRIVLRRKGHPHEVYLYALPSAAQARGVVLAPEQARELRKARAAKSPGGVLDANGALRTEAAQKRHLNSWAGLASASRLSTDELCANCSDSVDAALAG